MSERWEKLIILFTFWTGYAASSIQLMCVAHSRKRFILFSLVLFVLVSIVSCVCVCVCLLQNHDVFLQVNKVDKILGKFNFNTQQSQWSSLRHHSSAENISQIKFYVTNNQSINTTKRCVCVYCNQFKQETVLFKKQQQKKSPSTTGEKCWTWLRQK